MTGDQDPGEAAGQSPADETKITVDARHAIGVAVGDGVTQINNYYGAVLTWSDGVAASALTDSQGHFDSPYRGLSAFEAQDAAFFFGRDPAGDELLDLISQRMDSDGLVVVSGISGVGKSSLVRAGVLPRWTGEGLRAVPGSQAWPCLMFTPTGDPLGELARWIGTLAGLPAPAVRRELAASPEAFALLARQVTAAVMAGSGRSASERPRATAEPRLLLVIDQFEQLFTQCPDEGQRQAFIAALRAATTSDPGSGRPAAALAVAVVRNDFEARCADYPELAAAVQERYLLTPMSERQLRLAITEPARKAGSSVEQALVDELLEKVVRSGHPAQLPGAPGLPPTSRAGVLPLLSFALDEAWRVPGRRPAQAVTLADYERVGGIEGAIAKSAQGAYDQLTPAQQTATREIFVRLTATTPDGDDLAGRASTAELLWGKTPEQAADVRVVLEQFAGQRLLTLAGGTVEISHEVLLKAWPLLRDEWLARTQEDRIVRSRLRNSAAEWDLHSRDPSYLYAGSLLDVAAATADRISADPVRYPALGPEERGFLQASNAALVTKTRRRRALRVLLAALTACIAAAAVVAYSSEQTVAKQRNTAAVGLLIAESADPGTQPWLADLRAVAAWRIDPEDGGASYYAMLSAAAQPDNASLIGAGGPVESLAFSPDGKTVATAVPTPTGTVRLWNVAARSPYGPLQNGKTDGTYSVAFSPDSQVLAVGTGTGQVGLVSEHTGTQVAPLLDLSGGPVTSLAFSHDGANLAAGTQSGDVMLWRLSDDVPTGKPLTLPVGGVNSIAFSPDGRLLATGTPNGYLRLWNVATGRPLDNPRGSDGGAIYSVAFSPDGQTLATGDHDGSVQLWHAATGTADGSPLGPDRYAGVFSVVFSPDGHTLASGRSDGSVQLWDVASRAPARGPLTAGSGAVNSLAFSPDGKTLASGNGDGTVRLWNMAVLEPVGTLVTGNTSEVLTMAFSPAGGVLASGGEDGTLRLWNMMTGRQIGSPLLAGHFGPFSTGSVYAVAFNPEGRTLASGGQDGFVRQWDAANGQPAGPGELMGQADSISSVAYSPGGTILASGSLDDTVWRWNPVTGKTIGRPLNSHTGSVYSVAFSPDGKILAAGTNDSAIQLWNAATGKAIDGPLISHAGPVISVAFSPEGRTLAAASDDGTVWLWNVATHQPTGTLFTGSAGPVNSVAFSPDGDILASGSTDGTVRLWDVATHQQIGNSLPAAGGSAISVAFSPDGKTLAVGDNAGTVQLWDVSYLIDPQQSLCADAGAHFSPSEWATYVPAGPAYQNICP
jgi:WD40 repeat protein